MTDFTEIIIKTQPFMPELISGVAYMFTTLTGIEERENEIACYFTNLDDDDLDYLKQLLENLKRESMIERFEFYVNTIEPKNWNEEWEKTIEPIKVSERFVIKPSFREYYPQKNEIVINIDPKMSFGTGYHQSTRIMIRLIEKFIKPEYKVLDIGTGTGILAIVCAKLGASEIITCDNDEFVQDNVLENFEKNDCQVKCSFVFATIDEIQEKDFDLILANIQKNVLIDIAEKIKLKIKNNGTVILSGLLLEDEKEICNKYNSLNFKLVATEIEDEWIGLVFKYQG